MLYIYYIYVLYYYTISIYIYICGRIVLVCIGDGGKMVLNGFVLHL